ncbi:hypothetical protein SprV_0301042700 [Sparganum proliferum]
MDLFAAACENFGLIINTEELVAMPPDAVYVVSRNNVKSAQVLVVDIFTYLGSILSRETKTDDEVASRISESGQAYDRLQNTVFNRHSLHIDTELKMYKAVILPTLLYGAVYKMKARRLNHFHLSCLRRILTLSWHDLMPDTDVVERTRILGI